MPTRCIVAGCSNTYGSKEGVSLHSFPKDPNLRKIWASKVRLTRAHWKGPSDASVICSEHFEASDFEEGMWAQFGLKKQKRLKQDAMPNIKAPSKDAEESKRKQKPRPAAEKRKKMRGRMDMIQLFPSKVDCDGSALSLDPALLYSACSVSSDDIKPAASFPDGNLSRNSSFKLFPLWSDDNDRANQLEKIVQFGNGSSDLIDISSIYQDALQKDKDHHMASLCHGFQGLDLMDTWLLNGKKDPDLAHLNSSCFTNNSYNQDTPLKGPPFNPMDNFNKMCECDPCIQECSQEVIDGRFEKIPSEFRMYAFHNQSNSNNTQLQKEFNVEQDQENLSNCGSSTKETKFVCEPNERETCLHKNLRGHCSFRGYENYNTHSLQRTTFSTSESCYSAQHAKVNGRIWKTGEHVSPNLQNVCLFSRKCQINAFDSTCNFIQAANFEFQNGDYQHPGKNGPVWSNADALNPSGKSISQNGNCNSRGNEPLASSPVLSDISSRRSLDNHLLTPVPKQFGHSQTSLGLLEAKQDRLVNLGKGHPDAWSRGLAPGIKNLNTSGSHSQLDLPVSKDHHNQHDHPCSFLRGTESEDPDEYHYNQTKHSLDGCDEGRGMRKDINWFPQANAYGGFSEHHYSSENNYWCRQDQEMSSASDFCSSHFSPPFHVTMEDLQQNPSLGQLGRADVCRGGLSVSQSGFPFPDLIEMLQSEDFSHLRPFITQFLSGDAQTPYFGCPPLFNKYRPMRNRSGPASELHMQLELCYEQWRTLEKERKQTEANLARNFPGRRISSSNNTHIPCLSAKPSRVDRLIVDQLREHARVVILVGKMERLCSTPVHANITTTLDRHREAIRFTQQCRKEETVNTANRKREGASRYSDDKDILALAEAIKELAVLTRKARTALWCAVQMILPKGVLGRAVQQAELCQALLELCSPGECGTQGLGGGKAL